MCFCCSWAEKPFKILFCVRLRKKEQGEDDDETNNTEYILQADCQLYAPL